MSHAGTGSQICGTVESIREYIPSESAATFSSVPLILPVSGTAKTFVNVIDWIPTVRLRESSGANVKSTSFGVNREES